MTDQSNIFDNIQNSIIDNALMIRIAEKAQIFIRKRVYSSEFIDGSTGGPQYSTTPMPIPYGLFIKMFGKSYLRKSSVSKNKTKWFNKNKKNATFTNAQDFKVYTSKTGHVIVILPGGYKQWREINGRPGGPVDLTWSGRMMRNLGILRVDQNSVSVGFPSMEESQKAYYQHVGAGKKRVTRKFMDLTQTETDELGDLVTKLVLQKFQ